MPFQRHLKTQISSFGKIRIKELEIHLSILSPSVQVEFTSEEDLISQIRPEIDGLILVMDTRKGTFYRRSGNLFQ